MTETLTTLLTAHLLGDFIFQTDQMVKRKQHLGTLLLHVVIVSIASWLLMGRFHGPVLLILFLSHLGIDAVKAFWTQDTLVPFLVDQFVHLAVLVGLAGFFPEAAADGWWSTGLKTGLVEWYFASLSLLSGLILVVPVGGIVVAKVTKPLLKEIGDDNIQGLEKGGRYIGWLERFLAMLLLLINQPSGIGFLVAAKSILRFGEIKDAGQRKVAEYIIIGTFLSFGWALSFSVLTQQAIHHWLPPKGPNAAVAEVKPAPPPTPATERTTPTTSRPPAP